MKKSTNPFSGLLKGRLSLFQNQFLDSSHPSQERYPDPALVIPDKRFEKYCQFNDDVEKLWTCARWAEGQISPL